MFSIMWKDENIARRAHEVLQIACKEHAVCTLRLGGSWNGPYFTPCIEVVKKLGSTIAKINLDDQLPPRDNRVAKLEFDSEIYATRNMSQRAVDSAIEYLRLTKILFDDFGVQYTVGKPQIPYLRMPRSA